MYLLLALFLIIFEMSAEGFKLRKWHVASEWIEFVYRAVVTLICLAWITRQTLPWMEYNPNDNVKLILAFLFLRFGIGDAVHNLSARINIGYIGKTKSWDKAVWWLITRGFSINFYLYLKGLSALVGILWLLSLNYM